MSKWIDNFNKHPLIGVWSNMMSLLDSDELDECITDDSVDDISRLRKVFHLLDGIFEQIDPELTPVNHLANIQKNVQNCINEINGYLSDKNIAHLTTANTSADTLLIQFHQIPASLYSINPESLKKSVEAYSTTMDKHLYETKRKSEAAIEGVVKQMGDIGDQATALKTKLDETASQLKSVEQAIQKQTAEFNTQYQRSEKERSDQFKKAFEKYIDQSDSVFKELSTKASKIIEVLTKLQDDASKVYGVTINTLQSGAYSSYANEEGKSADKFRIFASGLMLVGVCILVIPELLQMYQNGEYTFDWAKMLGRVSLSLVLFVPAFYLAKESGKHRNNEIVNRRRQHILSTLDPYIELMEKDAAQELKSHVAKTVFSEAMANPDSDKETSHIISQLANLAKQIKSK